MKEETATKILKKVVEDYSQISQSFSETRNHNWEEFDSYLPYIKDKDNLLDLGCGNGRFYKYISDKRKLKYTGTDNNQELLEHAKKLNPDGKFIAGDLLDIPGGNYDIITCIAAFHHIPSKNLRTEALKEVHGKLAKNGRYIVSVWNLFQPKYKKYIWKARKKSIKTLGRYDSRDTLIPWAKSGVERYYYAFTQKELRKLLTVNGFKIIKEHKGNNFVFICQKS